MKVVTSLFLSFTTMALLGCSGGSDSSTASSVRAQVFSDSSVTAFSQTGGVAFNKPTFMDSFIGKAYAIDGNISCVEGAPVSFSLDALGNTVLVDTTCNSKIDLSIRQSLLESMAGKHLLMYWGGGHDTRADGRTLTFRAAGSFWGTYTNIVAGSAPNCKDKLTFDEATGSVTIENDSASSVAAGATNQVCLDSEFTGATADDYKKVLKFRFKEGNLEMHSDSTFPQDNDINQLCIDQNANGVCD